MIRLDKRLNRVYEVVLSVDPKMVVDIGCDHGKLGAKCAGKGIKTILTDISIKSLGKAERLFESLKLDGTFMCTDGLEGIDFTDALVVIAGMGGEEIIKILSSSHPKQLVLCPHHNVIELREFLVEGAYRIVTDIMVLERGIFYSIIFAEFGQDKLSDKELIFGRDNLKRDNPDFEKFVLREYEKFEKIVKNTKISDTKVLKYVTMLEELIKGWSQ
ncbi:MAG: class I SAM-dependent methyltransferase [Christensenellaceae bacterium]|nr:class I SAM-dependent methyltransferase [Christensenellaceae bacterium]